MDFSRNDVVHYCSIVIVVLSASIAGNTELYTDVHCDVMAWLYGGSLAHGKVDQFIEGSQNSINLN